MIVFENVAARSAPLALSNVSLTLGAGLHALVGSIRDGGPLILALAAGTTRPRKGRVFVLEGSPTDARVRRAVAFVPMEVQLPQAMRVDEILDLAAKIREEPPRAARERLATSKAFRNSASSWRRRDAVVMANSSPQRDRKPNALLRYLLPRCPRT